jgi:uncharacterized membrane protein
VDDCGALALCDFLAAGDDDAGAARLAALQGMRPILLLPLAPVFLNVASLVPAISSQDLRFEYPTVLIGPLLIAFYAGVCSLATPAASRARPLDAREV